MGISDLWDDTLPARGSEAWMRASEQEKQVALDHASDFLNTLPYKGKRASASQKRSWPRVGVFRDDGARVTGVPEEIKKTTALVAGFILAKIPYEVPALGWVIAGIGHLLKEWPSLNKSDISWH